MAFTAAQKKDIRKYLGVPFGFYDLNTRLESMLNKVGDDATDSAEVILWLTELATIDTELQSSTTSGSYSYGALKRADEVEFHPITEGDGSSSSTIGYADRGRILIQRIARALGVDDMLPNGDYFGKTRKVSVPLMLG